MSQIRIELDQCPVDRMAFTRQIGMGSFGRLRMGAISCYKWLGIPLLAFFCLQPLLSQDIQQIKDQDPFKITGSLGISTIFYTVQGRESNRKPFTWILNGSPRISLYGMDIPIQISVSEQERDFRQPFNRFGVSPYYKWIKLHLGFHNLRFSQYSLVGHAMTGAGFELSPGPWRISYMRGQLLRAVQPTEFIDDIDFVVRPTYARRGQSIKIGYQTDKSEIHVVLLDAQDRINSLVDSILPDLPPAANTIIALTGSHQFTPGVSMEAEYAQSSFTENIESEPFDPAFGWRLDRFFANSRTSTKESSALDLAVRVRKKKWQTVIQYQRISPDYRSMGAYFFLNDVEKLTIAPSIQFLNNKIQFSGSLGLQRNNLQAQKSLRTLRNIGSARLRIRPHPNYTVSVQMANYGITQRPGLEQVDEERQVAQVTRNWTVNQQFVKSGQIWTHQALLNWQTQNLNDRNALTSAFTNFNNQTIFGSYGLTYLPSRSSLNMMFTFTAFENTQLTTRYYGPNLSIQQSLLKNAIRLSLRQSWLTNTRDNELERKVTRTSLRASIKVSKSHRINVRTYLNDSESFNDRINAFNESKFEMQYVYTFH